jgi:hypothetical protein
MEPVELGLTAPVRPPTLAAMTADGNPNMTR